MSEPALYLIILLGSVITIAIAFLLWANLSFRPEGKVKSFKTRYTPTVWTPEQMDYALQVFTRVWFNHFPGKQRKVKKIINNLNIEWVPSRWKRNNVIAAAEVMSTNKLRLWRGPRIRDNRYKMSYTAFPEGLIQILVYNLEGRILDPSVINKDYNNVITDVKNELQGQVSHGIRQIHKTNSD